MELQNICARTQIHCNAIWVHLKIAQQKLKTETSHIQYNSYTYTLLLDTRSRSEFGFCIAYRSSSHIRWKLCDKCMWCEHTIHPQQPHLPKTCQEYRITVYVCVCMCMVCVFHNLWETWSRVILYETRLCPFWDPKKTKSMVHNFHSSRWQTLFELYLIF